MCLELLSDNSWSKALLKLEWMRSRFLINMKVKRTQTLFKPHRYILAMDPQRRKDELWKSRKRFQAAKYSTEEKKLKMNLWHLINSISKLRKRARKRENLAKSAKHN